MVGIELVADQKKKAPYPIEERIGRQVCQEAKRRGVLLRPLGDVIVLMPPLSISIKEMERLISVVGESIQKVTSKKAAAFRRRHQKGDHFLPSKTALFHA